MYLYFKIKVNEHNCSASKKKVYFPTVSCKMKHDFQSAFDSD
jgi:hypothetical protein